MTGYQLSFIRHEVPGSHLCFATYMSSQLSPRGSTWPTLRSTPLGTSDENMPLSPSAGGGRPEHHSPFVNRLDLGHPPTHPEPSSQAHFSSSPHRMFMNFVYPLVSQNYCDLVSLSDYLVTRILRRYRVCTEPGGCSKSSSEAFLHPLHDIAPSSSTGRSMPAMIQHATIDFHYLLGERRHITIVCQLLLRAIPV
jgi:hypothetical protein